MLSVRAGDGVYHHHCSGEHMHAIDRLHGSHTRRAVAVLAAILLAAGLLVVGGSAAPAHAAPLEQCNGVGNGGGEGYDCSVTITNQFDMATGVGSSTIRTVACNGPANTDPLPVCIDSGIIEVAGLTTEVTQCNASVGGTGGSLYCDVTVTNTIVGAATTSTASVNQCVGSLGGGGIVPGSVCDPTPAAVDGATITQCNGSVNGGGGYMVCTVGAATSNSAFPMTINQCNGSAEGIGTLMVCSSNMSTVIVPAAVVETPAPPQLAATGSDAQPLALAAAVLLLGGLLALRAARIARR